MKKKIFWTIKYFALFSIIISLILIIISNYKINNTTQNRVFNDINSIPTNKVGLLLGTSKYLSNGNTNYYFKNRIDAAEKLYKAGKIIAIVISGDNSHSDYNEPQDMKDELTKRGIPDSCIYLDYAGFRTYDSIYRMKVIFGQTNFTVISQQFQNQRAIFIGNSLGLNIIGFNAKDIDKYNGFKTNVREYFARVKVFMDILFNKKPKFLGEQILIN